MTTKATHLSYSVLFVVQAWPLVYADNGSSARGSRTDIMSKRLASPFAATGACLIAFCNGLAGNLFLIYRT